MPTPADILAARRRIAGMIAETPLERSAPLSQLCAAEVYLKLECAQITGSFKLRGAANALLSAPPEARIVACSAGNHALGIAHAAAHTGREGLLVVPANASLAKIAALRRYPVQLLLHGASYDEAEAEALRLAREEGLHFISPYNHPAVIAGQGTLACEIIEQLPQTDVLIVGVSGGGLIAGIGRWAKAIKPDLRLVGVQAANAPAMAESLRAGRIVSAQDLPTLADGLGGNIEPGSITFPLCQQLIDEMQLVSEAQIAAAMRYILDEHHLVIEGAAAVVAAALLAGMVEDLAGKHVVALLCGRNVATDTLRQVLEMTP